jgi:pSer/pThr/pTyr-binding forkhead associated (FHA) protein
VVVKEMKAPAPVPEQPAVPAPAAPVAERAPKPARGRGPGRLRILEPPSRQGESYALTDEITIGRGGGCGIVLADDTYVSTLHARLYQQNGQAFVEDLGSTNGTFVNAKQITSPTRLKRGDQVQFGQTVAEVIR